MKNITLESVSDLNKGDRIKITYLNKCNETITKTTRFYGTEGNLILVYVPKKQKQVWEIPVNTECEIIKM